MNIVPSEKFNDDLPGCEYRIADYDERSARIEREVLAEVTDLEMGSEAYWSWMRGLSNRDRVAMSQEMTKRFFDSVYAEIDAERPGLGEIERRGEFIARMYGPTLAHRWLEHWKERENRTP